MFAWAPSVPVLSAISCETVAGQALAAKRHRRRKDADSIPLRLLRLLAANRTLKLTAVRRKLDSTFAISALSAVSCETVCSDGRADSRTLTADSLSPGSNRLPPIAYRLPLSAPAPPLVRLLQRSGSVTVNVVPSEAVEVTPISPPCATATSRAM